MSEQNDDTPQQPAAAWPRPVAVYHPLIDCPACRHSMILDGDLTIRCQCDGTQLDRPPAFNCPPGHVCPLAARRFERPAVPLDLRPADGTGEYQIIRVPYAGLIMCSTCNFAMLREMLPDGRLTTRCVNDGISSIAYTDYDARERYVCPASAQVYYVPEVLLRLVPLTPADREALMGGEIDSAPAVIDPPHERQPGETGGVPVIPASSAAEAAEIAARTPDEIETAGLAPGQSDAGTRETLSGIHAPLRMDAETLSRAHITKLPIKGEPVMPGEDFIYGSPPRPVRPSDELQVSQSVEPPQFTGALLGLLRCSVCGQQPADAHQPQRAGTRCQYRARGADAFCQGTLVDTSEGPLMQCTACGFADTVPAGVPCRQPHCTTGIMRTFLADDPAGQARSYCQNCGEYSMRRPGSPCGLTITNGLTARPCHGITTGLLLVCVLNSTHPTSTTHKALPGAPCGHSLGKLNNRFVACAGVMTVPPDASKPDPQQLYRHILYAEGDVAAACGLIDPHRTILFYRHAAGLPEPDTAQDARLPLCPVCAARSSAYHQHGEQLLADDRAAHAEQAADDAQASDAARDHDRRTYEGHITPPPDTEAEQS